MNDQEDAFPAYLEAMGFQQSPTKARSLKAGEVILQPMAQPSDMFFHSPLILPEKDNDSKEEQEK